MSLSHPLTVSLKLIHSWEEEKVTIHSLKKKIAEKYLGLYTPSNDPT